MLVFEPESAQQNLKKLSNKVNSNREMSNGLGS
jgi:hypothetical protein